MASSKHSIDCCGFGFRTSGSVIYLPTPKKRRCPPVEPCCPNNQDNSNTNTSNPTNTNTFNPIINVNPVINIPPTPPPSPVNGEQGLLTEFDVDQPSTQRFDIPQIPIPALDEGVTLATVRLAIDNITDRVWLNGTVGWNVINESPTVEFFITRTRSGGTEEIIFSTVDEAVTNADDSVTTSFIFVDETPILTGGQQLVEYRLKTQTDVDNQAVVVGPIIFTAAEIRANP